jgi:Metallo-beta-lactamase superfamily
MVRMFAGTLVCVVLVAAPALAGGEASASGQGGRGNQAPGPTITVHGHTFTQQSLFQRNIGGRDDQTTAFPPHKIIGNIYYVGTKSLAAFLIVTPQGHILVNSTYERNVPIIQKSVEQLGFKFSDIKILLGSHAHGDHQEGDALVKELTGAQVLAMAEDVPALRAMKPGGKEHPIDRVLHDGESVTLGGTTLVARLTPGHSRGCTTWTLKAQDNGKTYDVVIIGSFGTNPGFQLVNNADVPDIAGEFERAFKVAHSRSTRALRRADRTRSSIQRATRWKSISPKRCSAPSWPNSRRPRPGANADGYRGSDSLGAEAAALG